MFSLCIPTMNRYDNFLSKYLPLYLENSLIDEIIITDETGEDVHKIRQFFQNSKLVLHINENKLGPFLNKLKACSMAKNEWIALIDSDNFADYNYFLVAKNFIDTQTPTKNSILAPYFAMPNFNFSYLSGVVYKKGMFDNNKKLEEVLLNNSYSNSETLMNTGNYIINKFLVDNLDLSNETENIKMSSACDVIYLNTLLFEQLDLNLYVVPNLSYNHVVHNGSIYIQTHAQFRDFNNNTYNRYRKLI